MNLWLGCASVALTKSELLLSCCLLYLLFSRSVLRLSHFPQLCCNCEDGDWTNIFFPSVFRVVRHILRLIIRATVDSKSITDGTHWCIIITLVMLMPLCFFFFSFLSCIWGRANGCVHQRAHVTLSVCERGHGEQKCGNVRNNKVSRGIRSGFFLSYNVEITCYYEQSTLKI